MKMPDPMMPPMTTIVASKGPNARLNDTAGKNTTRGMLARLRASRYGGLVLAALRAARGSRFPVRAAPAARRFPVHSAVQSAVGSVR